MAQGEEVSGPLPEDLMERILARMPFPLVLKVRVLSKSWLARMSPISSQDNEQTKSRAMVFQNQLQECRSTNWKSFYPVTLREEDLFGYDRESHVWRHLPSLSFLPGDVYKPYLVTQKAARNARLTPGLSFPEIVHWTEGQKVLQIDGALVLLTTWARNNRVEHNEITLCVANVVTRSWKQLPPRPSREEGQVSFTKLVCHRRESYKVMVVSFESKVPQNPQLLQIYDSVTAAWKVLNISEEYFNGRAGLSGYVEGALMYNTPCGWPGEKVQILVVDVNEETLEELSVCLASPDVGRDVYGDFPVICEGSLLMIMPIGLAGVMLATDNVLWVDLSSRRLLDGDRGPSPHVGVGQSTEECGRDWDCVFLALGHNQRVLMQAFGVDLTGRAWGDFRSLDHLADGAGKNYHGIHFPSRPGWNPFVAI